VRRGEIWWGEYADAGWRPFLILTRTAAVPVLNALVVAQLTRTLRDIPSHVVLTPEDDGVPKRSAVNLDSVRRVPKAALTSRICTLSGARMAEVCSALALALGCRSDV
jgi:mRNA interferase MazF